MRIVRKIWKDEATNRLITTIPNDQGLKEGDYMEVKRVK